jgi:hypothetical protein
VVCNPLWNSALQVALPGEWIPPLLSPFLVVPHLLEGMRRVGVGANGCWHVADPSPLGSWSQRGRSKAAEAIGMIAFFSRSDAVRAAVSEFSENVGFLH